MSAYAASDNVLVYLIQQSIDGSPERKLAARFILDCLRKCETTEEVEDCIHEMEEAALLDVSNETRQLAKNIGLRV